MMGVCRVSGKRRDRFKGKALAAGAGVELLKDVLQFQLRVVLAEDFHQFFHDLVIKPGGCPHFFLLVGGLNSSDTVYDGRAVHIAAGSLQFLQAQQKPGGPVFIDGNQSGSVHNAAENFHAVLRIVVILNFYAQIPSLPEQVVDQQLMVSVSVQVEHQQPLAGVNPRAGKIENHRRVGNNELGNIFLGHSGENCV